MNDVLNTSLHRAVDSAIDQAMAPDAMRQAVAERVRAKRRRRPGLVIGSTLGSLALVGGTAFAAVQLVGDDDRPAVPDVIGSPRTSTPPTTTPTGEPAPEPTPPPEPVITLPVANPDAVFPECGAILEPRTGVLAIALHATEAPAPFGTTEASAPLGPTLLIEARNEELTSAEGLAGMPVVVAVKDGVVVGSSAPDPAQVAVEMRGDGGVFPTTTGTLATTLCSDPSTPLPAGRYSIWAAQDFTFSEVYYYSDEYNVGSVPVDPVTPDAPYRALSQVASLWIDTAGQSTGHPGLAPGWPAALTHEAAFRADNTEPESVVWLGTSTMELGYEHDAELVPSRDFLLDLGYTETDIPFQCQAGLDAVGVDQAHHESSFGTGVIFATSGEAQTFVDLWEPLHGPVRGVVTGHVGVGAVPVEYAPAGSTLVHCRYPVEHGWDSARMRAVDEAQQKVIDSMLG